TTRAWGQVTQVFEHDFSGAIRVETRGAGADLLLVSLSNIIEEIQESLRVKATRKPVARESPLTDRFGSDGTLERLSPGAPAPGPNGEIYVSYAWGGDLDDAERMRADAVDRLCEEARARGIEIVRDRDRLKFGDRISKFMAQLV